MKQNVWICAILLCIALLAGVVGCGTTTTESTTQSETSTEPVASVQETDAPEEAAPAAETPQATEETTTAEQPAETVEETSDLYPLTDEDITMTYWIAGEASDVDAYFTQQPVYVAIQEQTGITLDFQVVSMQASSESFNLAIASGEYPDLIANVGSYYAQGISAAIQEEIIVDLGEYLETYMPDYQAILESNIAFRKSVEDENGRIGVAANLLQENYPVTNGPVIRQDWLDQLGLEVPVTYEDYHTVLTAFKNELGADAALWIPFTGSIAGNYLAAGFGIASYSLPARSEDPFYQVDGTVAYGPAEEGYRSYLELLHTWYSEGLVDQDFMSAVDPRLPDASKIVDGHTGLWYDMTNNMLTYDSDDPNFAITPIGDAVQQVGDVNHFRGGDSVIDSGQGVSVSTDCAYPDLAAGLLNYNYTDAGILLTNYGVQGLSYELDENGNPQYTTLILDNPDGLSVSEAMSLYTMSKGNVYDDGSKYLQTYSDLQVEATEVWAQFDNDYAMPVGAIFTAEEADAYNACYNDVSTIVSEMTLKFIVGDADLDGFDAFVESLYGAGLQDCIDLKQAALDRYYS
jgi:putative aldouronate transport system substrate-binding protein